MKKSKGPKIKITNGPDPKQVGGPDEALNAVSSNPDINLNEPVKRSVASRRLAMYGTKE